MTQGTPELDKARKKAKIFEWQAQDLKQRVDSLQRKTDTDSLTGLLNRRAFEVRARAMLSGLARERRSDDPARRLGIIFCDIDHFKSVNDTLGHQAGDEVLQKIASTLRHNIQPQDIVGRWGGEEFAICVVDGDHNQLAKIADRLRKNIEDLNIRVGDRIVTVSFGVEAIVGTEDLETAIKHADDALYSAKNSGRNRVVFYAEAS